MAKILSGKVKLTKMPKTVIVTVERKFRHPFYGKVITRSKKYKVHNEKIDLKDQDEVLIKEIRPISKEKHFIVIKKL